MRRLTHGTDRNGLSSAMRRSEEMRLSGGLPQRVLARWLGTVPLALLIPLAASSCSQEPVGVTLDPPGSSGGGGSAEPIDETDTELLRRCGSDGIKCGEGCCTSGNTCTDFGRCIPDLECTTSAECSADSQCSAGRCVPWSVLPAGSRFSRSCRNAVDLPSVTPEVQCQWPGNTVPDVNPEQVQVIGTPMVIDFNSDGDPATIKPSIVFISYEGPFATNTGTIRVIDGSTCELQDSIVGQFPFTPEVPLSLGDVNNDGRPDIVAADEQPIGGGAIRSGIAVFELATSGASPTFQALSRIQSTGTGTIAGFALHDVDNDDVPEIFTEKNMHRWSDEFNSLIDVAPISPGNRAPLSMIEPPTVADIDGDRQAEVVTPGGIFTWDTLNNRFLDKFRAGTEPLWRPDELIDGQGAFMGMANLRGDWSTGLPQGKDSAELVVVGFNGSVYVRQVDGQTRFRMEVPGLAGGPPVIADIDGDGRMEFASGGLDTLTVFDLDCTSLFYDQQGCERGSGQARSNGVIWEARTQGARSGVAVFDFDGDGRSELVYADQCFMRVYDGLTGDVLFSTPRMSTTQWEYPVVADTDGDGFSEIVTTSNDNDTSVSCPATDPENENAEVRFQPSHGVTVWKEADDRWAGSRPIWNQHNYYVTNVRDDGTIPPMGQVETHWTAEGPNTFRQNVQGETGKSLSLVDVTTAGVPTFDCKPAQNMATVTVDLCNRGATMLRENETEVALVNPARPADILCQATNDRDIDSGECIEVSCDVPVAPRSEPFNLMIVGDPLLQVDECLEDNNRSMIAGVVCQPEVPR